MRPHQLFISDADRAVLSPTQCVMWLPGLPWVWRSPWVWGGYEDDLPSPQTHGDSMGIFNQPEITL